MPIYMNYNDIVGIVTEEKHKGWIQCQTFQWGVSRDIVNPTPGRQTERESQAPTVNEIHVTKATDIASPLLLTEALAGEGVDVKIQFCKTEKPFFEYMTYILENCMISAYSVSSGGDRPMESLLINFTGITFTYNSRNEAGELESSARVGYDVGKAITK